MHTKRIDNLTIRYHLILVFVVFGFTNFIACGAKFYKVSLEEDIQHLERQNAIPASSNDPTSEFFGIHAVDGWKTLPIAFKTDQKLTNEQKQGLKKAMVSWEKAVGKKLFTYIGPDKVSGDTFKNLYSSLEDSTNGFYADYNWKKTGKSHLVLATTIWDNDKKDLNAISDADIRFNMQDYLIGDAFSTIPASSDMREIVDMETLALHELGHLIGLTHVSEDIDHLSIMNPSLYIGEGLANRGMSEGDIRRIQKIYGCQDLACDVDLTLKEINSVQNGDSSLSSNTSIEQISGAEETEIKSLNSQKTSTH